MNKWIKRSLLMIFALGVLSGCGWMNKNDTNNSETTKDTSKDSMENGTVAEESVENLVAYLKEKNIALDNIQSIDNMEFAAHEGRTFTYNGGNVYLYRVKSDDENMKKVLKEASENGKIKVTIDNKEKEYEALVNQDYLMLYDTSNDMSALKEAFPSYTYGGNTNINTMPNNNGNTTPNTDGNTTPNTNGNTTNDGMIQD